MSGQNEEVLDSTDEQDLDEFKSDHSGGGPVKGSAIEDAADKNADDPKADGKKKKKAESADKSSTKVDMKVEDSAPKTKAGMINAVLDEMKSKSKAELETLYAGVQSSLSEADEDDDDDDVDDEDDEDKGEKKPNPFEKKVAKEDLDLSADVAAIYADEDLSEDFKAKATVIVEAAVISQINTKLAEISEEVETELAEAKEDMLSEMADKVDNYLEYVVEEWMKDNELAIESGIRSELAESVMSGLKTLFEDHYIDVPDDKVDVLEEMGNRIAELEGQLDEQINGAVELRKDIEVHEKDDILDDVAEGLVDTDAEKLRSLAEGVDFHNGEDYRDKLELLKETYFPVDGKATYLSEDVDNEAVDDGTPVNTGPMAGYVNAISRTTIKSVEA